MRILHLSSVYAPDSVGGAEKVAETLAQAAVRAGHTVGVCHVAREGGAARCQDGVTAYPFAHRNPIWIGDPVSRPAPLRQLNKVVTLFNALIAADFAKVIDDFQPDVVHSHSMVELPPFIWQVAARKGVPVVHTLHDYDLLCIRAALFKDGQRCERLHRACAAFSLVKRGQHRHIDHVVAVSRAVLDRHLAAGLFEHLPEERRHVIWNPVHGADGARACGGGPLNGPIRFGFLGRLVSEKGIEALLRACRELPASGWSLQVAGKAPGGEQAMAPLTELARGLPVTFLGHVNPQAFLAGIDVLVVPSIWDEPFGLTALEAYAQGVAVIGSTRGAIRELVGGVSPTWLFDPDEPGALSARMRGLMSSGATPGWDARALLAQTRPDAVFDRYLEVYRQAARQSASMRVD